MRLGTCLSVLSRVKEIWDFIAVQHYFLGFLLLRTEVKYNIKTTVYNTIEKVCAMINMNQEENPFIRMIN